MESKAILSFLHKQEQELIIDVLSGRFKTDQVLFKVTGPNCYYKLPWRSQQMGDNVELHMICANAPGGHWDDIVARNLPPKLAAKIVREVN